MSISKHISYKEGVYSRTATRLGIKNNPNAEQMENMITIAEEVFEPLRAYVGGPIKINSFFRSPELNKAIGGSTKSQHCHGQAIDLDDTFGRCTNAEMFEFIKKYLNFDQIIWEFGDDNNPDWVHVSYVSPDQNRKRCLKAYKENGKTNYKII
jgi:zinc D-Ala-D-Ala carboxypeptidase